MNERELAIAVRRALLAIVKAHERNERRLPPFLAALSPLVPQLRQVVTQIETSYAIGAAARRRSDGPHQTGPAPHHTAGQPVRR